MPTVSIITAVLDGYQPAHGQAAGSGWRWTVLALIFDLPI
jgi:hypothetical protein